MSAAEKLKALDGRLFVDEGYHEYAAFDALPQIVAVVERSEAIWGGYAYEAVDEDEKHRLLGAALVALDEKLGAVT